MTKNNPGEYDCYAKADDDEEMFILLSRDPLAPILVQLWASLREQASGNPSKVLEARQVASRMIIQRSTKIVAEAIQKQNTAEKCKERQRLDTFERGEKQGFG